MSETLQRTFTRDDLMNMQSLLDAQPNAVHGDSSLCPVEHIFSDGIYMRRIFIPAGTAVVGKIHKHEHPNFLMSGTVRLATEDGYQELTGPLHLVSKPGTKRALVAITDLIWITVHLNPTNTKDLEVLENNIISPSYELYDRFKKLESNPVRSFFKSIIRRLS